MGAFSDRIAALETKVDAAAARESVEDTEAAELQRLYDELKAKADAGLATEADLETLARVETKIDAINAAAVEPEPEPEPTPEG